MSQKPSEADRPCVVATATPTLTATATRTATATPTAQPITNSVQAGLLRTSYNSAAQPHAPAGVYTITGPFQHVGTRPYRDLYFSVAALSGGNLLLNADGGPGGVGSRLSVPPAALGADGIFSPGESFSQLFRIGLQVRASFIFRVDLYATDASTPDVATSAALSPGPGSRLIATAVIDGRFDPAAVGATPTVTATPPPDGDHDGVLDVQDGCPTLAGPAGRQGCPFGIASTVNLYLLDAAHSGACPGGAVACKLLLAGAQVWAFDLNDATFQAQFGRNPGPDRYDAIVQAALARLSLPCTTSASGQCTVGVERTGTYLVIARYADSPGSATVLYGGTLVLGSDFRNGLASKQIQIIQPTRPQAEDAPAVATAPTAGALFALELLWRLLGG